MHPKVCAWITIITFIKTYWILPVHSNVTIKSVSWPHFSWATLYGLPLIWNVFLYSCILSILTATWLSFSQKIVQCCCFLSLFHVVRKFFNSLLAEKFYIPTGFIRNSSSRVNTPKPSIRISRLEISNITAKLFD